eukprot:3849675-Pyramimonas_sp.AAC.1
MSPRAQVRGRAAVHLAARHGVRARAAPPRHRARPHGVPGGWGRGGVCRHAGEAGQARGAPADARQRRQ